MWDLWESLILNENIRISRLVAGHTAVLAILGVLCSIFISGGFWLGAIVALLSTGLTIGVWKLGDWWKLRQALRKAQEGMPNRQRGFEVVTKSRKY